MSVSARWSGNSSPAQGGSSPSINGDDDKDESGSGSTSAPFFIYPLALLGVLLSVMVSRRR